MELLKLVTTSNYSDIANLHTLHFTTARTKSSQSAVSSPVVAWQSSQRPKFLGFRVPRLLSLLAGVWLTTRLGVAMERVQQWGLFDSHDSAKGRLSYTRTACLRTRLIKRVRARVTLRLDVYRHYDRFGPKPLQAEDQNSFIQLNPCGRSPYVTTSLTRG
jgi:hypothetical protein